MRAARVAVAAMAAMAGATAAAALAGCVSQPGARIAEQVKAVKAEETPEKLLERGRAFAAIGDYTRAEQYFSAALDEGGDPAVVLPLLLKVCVAEQRYRVAIDHAEPWLQKRPDDYRLRFLVGTLYATIGDAKTAREHYERVTQTAPKHADAHYALGVLLRDDVNDPVGADKHFREYLRLRPDGPHADEARASLLKTVR